MKHKYKKAWLIIGVILLILIVFNPGLKRFKEFSGFDNKEMSNVKKTYNFLVCSIYDDPYNDKKYFGILLNFIDISPKEKFQQRDTTIVSDTVTVNDIPPFLKSNGQNKVKMVFPDGSIGDIDSIDVATAQSLGAKILANAVDSSSINHK
jgi:ABC-type cobalt transport system substrate-binding protein